MQVTLRHQRWIYTIGSGMLQRGMNTGRKIDQCAPASLSYYASYVSDSGHLLLLSIDVLADKAEITEGPTHPRDFSDLKLQKSGIKV